MSSSSSIEASVKFKHESLNHYKPLNLNFGEAEKEDIHHDMKRDKFVSAN
jgi:hypothetical protein